MSDIEAVTNRERLPRVTVLAGGLALIAVIGFFSAGAGWLTCNEDVQSPEQAPHLCGTLGQGNALWFPPVAGAALLLVLAVRGLRAKTLALAAAVIVGAEGALLLMWALVSHGTIHY